jgi:hypothetical protein
VNEWCARIGLATPKIPAATRAAQDTLVRKAWNILI